MSIDFYIARQVDGGTRYAYRCDCSERWCTACDLAFDAGLESPAMLSCDDCTDVSVNMSNVNAADWMRWVGLTSAACGSVPAAELAVLCRRRLWDEARNHDPAITGADFARQYGLEGHPRVVFGERPSDYLRSRTAQILRMCEKAGDRLIAWG